jgi:hypothetical protein
VQGDIEDVARHIPASVRKSAEWSAIVNTAEENGTSYSKGLRGKPIFSDLYGTYTVTLQELKAVIKATTLADQTNIPKTTGQQANKEDDFLESAGTDQNADRLKHPPPRRSSPETFLPLSRQQTWIPQLPVVRPIQMRRHFLAKQAGRHL